MLTLYDYLPSQNGYKVRLLFNHLQRPYAAKWVSIFEGEGQRADFLAKSPSGAVPVLELEDGRVLAESNAILVYLAEGTRYLPADSWERAQVLRWMFFEEDFIQNGLAKTAASHKALAILERWLNGREFLTDAGYTIADISVFAYTSRADEAMIPLRRYPAVDAWVSRVRAQEHFLEAVHPYSIDPKSAGELP